MSDEFNFSCGPNSVSASPKYRISVRVHLVQPLVSHRPASGLARVAAAGRRDPQLRDSGRTPGGDISLRRQERPRVSRARSLGRSRLTTNCPHPRLEIVQGTFPRQRHLVLRVGNVWTQSWLALNVKPPPEPPTKSTPCPPRIGKPHAVRVPQSSYSSVFHGHCPRIIICFIIPAFFPSSAACELGSGRKDQAKSGGWVWPNLTNLKPR